MKTIFVIGPYNADSYEQKLHNINIAATAAKYLWSSGWAVICPHLNSALFEHSIASEDAFYEGYQSILRACSAGFVLPNWDSSKGSLGEISIAARFGIPLYFSSKYEPIALTTKNASLLRRYMKECKKEGFYEPTTTLKTVKTVSSRATQKHLVPRRIL